MTKYFKKSEKAILGPFGQKTKFPAKNGFVKYFSNITIIYQGDKNQKN